MLSSVSRSCPYKSNMVWPKFMALEEVPDRYWIISQHCLVMSKLNGYKIIFLETTLLLFICLLFNNKGTTELNFFEFAFKLFYSTITIYHSTFADQ